MIKIVELNKFQNDIDELYDKVVSDELQQYFLMAKKREKEYYKKYYQRPEVKERKKEYYKKNIRDRKTKR